MCILCSSLSMALLHFLLNLLQFYNQRSKVTETSIQESSALIVLNGYGFESGSPWCVLWRFISVRMSKVSHNVKYVILINQFLINGFNLWTLDDNPGLSDSCLEDVVELATEDNTGNSWIDQEFNWKEYLATSNDKPASERLFKHVMFLLYLCLKRGPMVSSLSVCFSIYRYNFLRNGSVGELAGEGIVSWLWKNWKQIFWENGFPRMAEKSTFW